MLRLWPLLLCMTFSLSAFAGGGDKGNIFTPIELEGKLAVPRLGLYGGEAVVCRTITREIRSVHLLDYADLDVLNPDLVKYEDKYSDLAYVKLVADKLEKYFPEVFAGFRNEAVKLATDFDAFIERMRNKDLSNDQLPYPGVVFQLQGQLTPINDSNHQLRYQESFGCYVEQLAVREKLYDRMNYIIQANLFGALSARDRRGLILHEAIYHSFQTYYGDTTSDRARYFHQILVQFKVKKLDRDILSSILTMSRLNR